MSFLARTSACTAAALLLLLAPALAAAAAAAADDSAAAPELLGDNPGVPPSLVGVWLEERDLTAAPYAPDKDGASSMILTRQWLNTADGGGNGYVR